MLAEMARDPPPNTFSRKRLLKKQEQISCTWPIHLGQNDRMVREIISWFHQKR
jgi:hypothetical protein